MSSEVDHIFAREARGRMERVEALVATGIPPPRTPERAELWRHVHSLKGTAESLGFERIGELSGDIATRLGAEGQPGTREVTPEDERVLREEVTELEQAVAQLH